MQVLAACMVNQGNQGMLRTLAPVAALLLSVAFLLMGSGLQNTLTPVRAGIESFSPLSIGGLGAGYYFGFVLGCLAGPWMVQRAGHIRTFAAMVSTASAVALAHPLLIDVAAWVALRVITGFCLACLFMIIESWLNETATNETRGMIFSVYLVVNLSVVTIGQLMLMLDDPADFALFTLASILLSLAVVPLSMTRSVQPNPPTVVRLRLMHLYRLSPVGVVGAFAVGVGNGAFWMVGPVVGATLGSGSDSAAIFMAVGAIAGAVGQWPLGLASDRMDRRRVIVFAAICGALVGFALFLFAEIPETLRLAMVFGYGLFAIPLYALAAAHMNDMIEHDGFVEAASGLLLIFSIGSVLGPMLASAAIGALGPLALFAFTATIHVLLAIFTLYRMRRSEPAIEADRGAFSEAAMLAQTIATVDPMGIPEDVATDQPAQGGVAPTDYRTKA